MFYYDSIFQFACDESGNHAGSFCSNPLPESHAKLVSQDNGGSSGDHCKPISDSNKLSPTIYRQQGVKGSTSQNVPISDVVDHDTGNTSSNSHVTKANDPSKDGSVGSQAGLSKGNAGKNWQSLPLISAPKVSTVIFSVSPVCTLPYIYEDNSCFR